jgi:perosamine synthetase
MISWGNLTFWGNEKKYVSDAMDSMWISGGSEGKYVKAFEKSFEDIFKCHALTTSNGTSSLQLIYRGLDLKIDDEILVPGYCFLAGANVALQLGIKPVFVDVKLDTWNMDPIDMKNKITEKTKAILAVHTFGNLCDMDSINSIAKQNNLYVIEDCAESIFSKYDGKYCGTLGDVGAFSFHSAKTITTGEGGLVTTKDKELSKKMSLIRGHGLPNKGSYLHTIVGHNFRLSNLLAAIGFAQMEQLDTIIENKKRIYNRYVENLNHKKDFIFQKIENKVDPVMWLTAIKLDCNLIKKDELISTLLNEYKIEVRSGFVNSSDISYFEKHEVPNSKSLDDSLITLPSHSSLTNYEIDYICESMLKTKNKNE